MARSDAAGWSGIVTGFAFTRNGFVLIPGWFGASPILQLLPTNQGRRCRLFLSPALWR